MPQGGGKYDSAATVARESTGAKGVVLIVIGGQHGSGFSVHAPMDVVAQLPELLRHVADEIERSAN